MCSWVPEPVECPRPLGLALFGLTASRAIGHTVKLLFYPIGTKRDEILSRSCLSRVFA